MSPTTETSPLENYDEQLNLRKRHPLGRLHLLCNEAQSVLARATLSKSTDVAYGESEGQKLDIFPAASAEAPLFVFVHGGYFRALDKRQYAYMARPLVRSGCGTVLINYDLAPRVRVGEIVEQNLRAISWIHHHIAEWGCNPDRIVLCGHSVGAFLVAKILEHSWPAPISKSIRGAVLLSGIFDLTSMRLSYLNRTLDLTEEEVETLSPMFARTRNFPPTLVAVGGNESDEFIDQSRRYSEKLSADGHAHDFSLLKNENHYTVSRLLSRARSPLMRQILRMLEPA